MARRKALMESVQAICFGPRDETIAIKNYAGYVMLSEKEKRKLYVCPDRPWYISYAEIKIDHQDLERAMFPRHQLHLFIKNLFSFHDLPYEEKLAKDALYFLQAAITE